MKDASEIAICGYGIGIECPTRGVPSRKIHNEVKAKLAREDKKVIVQDRFTSPWNMAV